MYLRKLETKDAQFMFEWMNDVNVTSWLQKNFADKTISDCEIFVNEARNDKKNLHLAIVNDNDTYMGTVSLKNITDISAEFAITIRTEAMGKGYSKYAMSKIIRIGFEEYGLKIIYWYVLAENKRAIRFYDKNGYSKISLFDLKNKIELNGLQTDLNNFIWYYADKY